MKTARNLFAIMLTLAALLSLTACAVQPQNEDSDAEWVYTNANHFVKFALSEQFCYYLDPWVLHCVDLTTGQDVVLCSLPGCLHDGEGCDAYLDTYDYNSMFFANDHLYYIHHREGKLYRRSAIGTEEVAVGTLAKEAVEAGKSVEIDVIQCVGSTLYYTADVVSPTDRNGTQLGTLIGCMDLNSGKDTVLLEQEVPEGYAGAGLDLQAARDGELLLLCRDGFQGSTEDPDYREKMRNSPVKLLRLNTANAEVTTVLEKLYKEMSKITSVWADKVYYYAINGEDKAIVYAYDLKTGKEEKLDTAVISEWLGGPYVTLTGNKVPYNLQTGEFLPCELERRPVRHAGSDYGIVIDRYIMSAEDPEHKVDAVEYCYIPFSAMADGIQLADLTVVRFLKSGYSN